MGMFHETERMIKHRQRCDVCKAATETRKEEGYEWEVVHYADFCDLCGDMFNHVIDFECEEGPFKGGRGMCAKCDGRSATWLSRSRIRVRPK